MLRREAAIAFFQVGVTALSPLAEIIAGGIRCEAV